MLFNYKAIDNNGQVSSGGIEAMTLDVAISSLQHRGLVISSIVPAGEGSLFERKFHFFEHVKLKDVVLLSRQMSTLFQAQVSALQIFRLLAAETPSVPLRQAIATVADDIQSGSSISRALSKHPKVFSDFYVNMVKAGEESGKLDDSFRFLADYLERNYEITSKAAHALVYPAFVIMTFIGVMILMLTTVIPNLSKILTESGQAIPIYTKIVLGASDLLVNYGIFVFIILIIGGFFLWRWTLTETGAAAVARFKISIPYLGDLYRKLYLSRIADNMNTMLISAIPIVRALEITGDVVGNKVYEYILKDAVESVKTGTSMSEAFGRHPEIPGIMVQMIRVGEETGELGGILETLSRFYRREVGTAMDTMVGLIEPLMIVLLGLGVGFLLTAVLLPIYNVSTSIS